MPDSSDNVNSGARASAVDWSRPIEAVHEYGTVYPAKYMCAASGGTVDVLFNSKHYNALKPSGYVGYGWRIRNVQPTTPELDPALWDRMVALVRSMADRYDNGRSDDESVARDAYPWMREARAIVADLPKPVDPDLIEAREVAVRKLRKLGASAEQIAAGEIEAGERDDAIVMHVALAAIKRGRQLATPEVSHVG